MPSGTKIDEDRELLDVEISVVDELVFTGTELVKVALALFDGTAEEGAPGAPPAQMPFHAAVQPGAGRSMPITIVTTWHCWPLKFTPRQRGCESQVFSHSSRLLADTL